MKNVIKTGFGWIEADRVRYGHDIVIHVDRTITKRKKKLSKDQKGQYGHTPVSGAELGFLADEKPEVVFIGTGQYGDLPVTPDAGSLLEHYDTVIMPTPEILPYIEREKRTFVALLHVTC